MHSTNGHSASHRNLIRYSRYAPPSHNRDCQDRLVLGQLVLIHGSSADAVRALALLMGQLLHILLGRAILLFKDGISLDVLKLGLEAVDVMAVGAAVGAASSIGEFVAIVLRLGSWGAPKSHRCQLSGVRGRSADAVKVQIFTNCPYRRPPSSPSLGRRRCGLIWQSSGGDAGCRRQSRRPSQHGRGHSACESESLVRKRHQYDDGTVAMLAQLIHQAWKDVVEVPASKRPMPFMPRQTMREDAGQLTD